MQNIWQRGSERIENEVKDIGIYDYKIRSSEKKELSGYNIIGSEKYKWQWKLRVKNKDVYG